MVNKVMLIGRLGGDPEVKYTPDGLMITNFTLATDEQRKAINGLGYRLVPYSLSPI